MIYFLKIHFHFFLTIYNTFIRVLYNNIGIIKILNYTKKKKNENIKDFTGFQKYSSHKQNICRLYKNK